MKNHYRVRLNVILCSRKFYSFFTNNTPGTPINMCFLVHAIDMSIEILQILNINATAKIKEARDFVNF
jgi:hypothetical protein